MENILEFFLLNRETIFIVILSIFLGIEVISHVPAILHTPLILGFLAVVLGTLNVVGGFVVTDRMLEMFKKKK
jgi:NAD(P) transhydrogenase subunit alpha